MDETTQGPQGIQGFTYYLTTNIETNSRGTNTSVKASVWYTPPTTDNDGSSVALVARVQAILIDLANENLAKAMGETDA